MLGEVLRRPMMARVWGKWMYYVKIYNLKNTYKQIAQTFILICSVCLLKSRRHSSPTPVELYYKICSMKYYLWHSLFVGKACPLIQSFIYTQMPSFLKDKLVDRLKLWRQQLEIMMFRGCNGWWRDPCRRLNSEFKKTTEASYRPQLIHPTSLKLQCWSH